MSFNKRITQDFSAMLDSLESTLKRTIAAKA